MSDGGEQVVRLHAGERKRSGRMGAEATQRARMCVMGGQIRAEPSAEREARSVGIDARRRTLVAAVTDIGRRVGGFMDSRPTAATAIVAVIVALGHAWWIWTHRHLGAFDADEAGYLSDALRMHGALTSDGPVALLREIRFSGTAPLIPLLSVPLLLVGPHDPRTAMMVQPMLMVFVVVAITGIARRLVPARAAVIAGCAVLAFPATMLAAQSYWFGLGVSAAMGAAVWSLLGSSRGINRWIWVFGLCVGLMALSRTMALGFVPALALAGVVAVGWNRRGLLRLVASLALGSLVALPWYLAAHEIVFGYLFTYGYGDRAARFGTAAPFARLVHLPVEMATDAGVAVPLVVLVGAGTILAAAWNHGDLREIVLATLESSDHAVLLTVLVAGALALLSTPNEGGWFLYPLLVPAVPLAAAVLCRAARWLRVAAALLLALQAVILLPSSWWLLPYGLPVPLAAHYEVGFAQYDERFGSTRRNELDETSSQWAQLDTEVTRSLRRIGGRTPVAVTMSGNMLLMNTNSLGLAAQMDGWTADLRVPETVATPQQRAMDLTPETLDRDGNIVERVLVIAHHSKTLFSPDADVESFVAQAEADGWEVVETFPMPIDGRVDVLRHVPS